MKLDDDDDDHELTHHSVGKRIRTRNRLEDILSFIDRSCFTLRR